MLITNITTTILVTMLMSAPAMAFQNFSVIPDDSKSNNSLVIHEDNFSCFQNLKCLMKENPFRASSLNDLRINTYEYQKFVVKGTSKNEEVYAVYDQNGLLIEATVTQINIALPGKIARTLVSGEFRDWTMIGNELEVHNFDKHTMLYKVVLQNGDEVRVEYFDRNGNRKNRIS
jgi:hypothetical protein